MVGVPAMRAVLVALVVALVSVFRSRASLHLEVLALRHQLAVLQGGGRRPQLKPGDRLLWVWLSRTWSGWQDTLVFVKPSTVISWQRKRFRDHWTRLTRMGTPGRPPIAQEIRDLIRRTSDSRRPLLGRLSDDPRSRAISCSLVYFNPRPQPHKHGSSRRTEVRPWIGTW